MINLSPLAADDYPDWLRIWDGYLDFYEVALPELITRRTFERLINLEAPIYGAIARDASDSPAGLVHWLTHVAMWTTTSYCYLGNLFVDPLARRAGAGAALIRYVRESAGWLPGGLTP